MKKNKIIILIALLFLLCGCTAEVNITIDENLIDEQVMLNVNQTNDYTKEQLSKAFREFVPAFAEEPIVDTMPDERLSGVSYYQRDMKELTNGYRVTYSYKYNFNNYNKARTVKEGFKSSSLVYDKKENTILVSTDNSGLLYFNQYPDLSDVKVNIKTDYKVKETNADIVANNVYTWNLNRNSNKNIYLLLEKEKQTIDTDDKNEDKENKNDVNKTEEVYDEDNEFVRFLNEHPFIVVIISILLFFIIILIINKFSKK